MKGAANFYLARINRVLIWFTLPFLVFFIACGYGATNPEVVGAFTGGLLTRTLSIYLHTVLAPAVLVLLLIHTLIGLRFTLMRWGVRDGKLFNAFLILLGAFAAALVIVLQTLSV